MKLTSLKLNSFMIINKAKFSAFETRLQSLEQRLYALEHPSIAKGVKHADKRGIAKTKRNLEKQAGKVRQTGKGID